MQQQTSPRVQLQPLSLREPADLQTAWTRNFFDLSFEWRRLFSEVLGTFFLVLVAAGGSVVNARSHGQVPLDARVVAPGLMVMAIIYFMGTVSGAHLNPAVTISFALRRNFPWRRVPGYIAAELVGAVLGALFLRATFGNVGDLGATAPGPGIGVGTALLIEIVLTVGLVSVILGTASGARNIGANAALAVGGYIVLAGLWAAPDLGSLHEPGPLAGAGAGRRSLDRLVGVRRRAVGGGGHRRRLRLDPAWAAEQGGRSGGPGGAVSRLGRAVVPGLPRVGRSAPTDGSRGVIPSPQPSRMAASWVPCATSRPMRSQMKQASSTRCPSISCARCSTRTGPGAGRART